MAFELDPSYKDVPTRIADFKEKHPEGCLRPVNPEQPYEVVTIGQQFFIVYAAAAYRTPDDPTPGIGVAWEPFPGKTSFTKDSELQNAETSAWGRAIVAVLASESKSVASAEDVRNRRADQDAPETAGGVPSALVANFKKLADRMGEHQVTAMKAWFAENSVPPIDRCTLDQANAALAEAQRVLRGRKNPNQGAGVDGAEGHGSPSGEHITGVPAPEPAPATTGEGEEPPEAGSSPEPSQGALTEFEQKAEAIAAAAPEVTP